MPEREREGASGPGGPPARERETPFPEVKPSPQRARRAVARLVATPTFIASASIVIVAIIAYGTTRTHLLYSGMGPACASASCTVTSPQTSGGAPNDASAKQGPKAGQQDSISGTIRNSGGNRGSGASGQHGGSSGSQTGGGVTGHQPAPGATAAAGPAKSHVVIVYRTLRNVHGGFVAAITISSRSKLSIRGWQLWMHYKSSRIVRITGARWFPASSHARDTGLAVPEPSKQILRPGATIRFTIESSGSPGAPDGCVFDGNHCSFSHA
ncbi:MAG TPA: hypothetical protein VGI74_21845 [Streptosporangiaceae bacterium]|jgi:hypothetical protein